MFYYAYVLQSLTDMKFYTGYTKDLKLRFEQHNKGLLSLRVEEYHLKLYIMKHVLIKAMLSEEKNT